MKCFELKNVRTGGCYYVAAETAQDANKLICDLWKDPANYGAVFHREGTYAAREVDLAEMQAIKLASDDPDADPGDRVSVAGLFLLAQRAGPGVLAGPMRPKDIDRGTVKPRRAFWKVVAPTGYYDDLNNHTSLAAVRAEVRRRGLYAAGCYLTATCCETGDSLGDTKSRAGLRALTRHGLGDPTWRGALSTAREQRLAPWLLLLAFYCAALAVIRGWR
jgi:hypothetical protein